MRFEQFASSSFKSNALFLEYGERLPLSFTIAS
jgi:hypothetical protein